MKENEVVLMSISKGELVDIIKSCFSTSNKEVKSGEKLTQQEAADFFEVVPATIIRWKKAGKIPFYKVGRKIYFLKEELIKVAQNDSSLLKA